jgi:hypothetical protein
MPGRLATWLVGTLRGEVPVSSLDGLRALGASAYALQEEAEALKTAPDWSPWTQEPARALFLVCAWNAFALQTVADQLLDADARLEPSTAGRVSASTLAFAQQCYTGAVSWLQSARLVQSDPDLRLSSALPAAIPGWPRVGGVRRVHVGSLRCAYDAVGPRAEYDAERAARVAPASDAAELELLRTQMRTSAEFAATLESRARSSEQLREACSLLVSSLAVAFTLGQATVMPSLLERVRLNGYRARSSTVVPVSAVARGWSVLDGGGTPIGTVARIEGEPDLGRVEAIVVSATASTADRRARVDQIRALSPGVVRLAVGRDELEKV